MLMHLKSLGYTGTVLFPTIGNMVNVQSTDIGKPDSRQPISVIIGNTDKKLFDLHKLLS
jgi:hypothetical protein